MFTFVMAANSATVNYLEFTNFLPILVSLIALFVDAAGWAAREIVAAITIIFVKV